MGQFVPDSIILRRLHYGKIRSCGSIAYAVFILIYGFLLDAVGYGLMPIVAGIVMGLCVLLVYSFIPVSMEEVGGSMTLLVVLYFINATIEITLMCCTFYLRRFHTFERLLLSAGLYVLFTLTMTLAGNTIVGAAFDAGGNKAAILLLYALQCVVALIPRGPPS